MSPVKQIVKASITSLWRNRAEFVPTASASCTFSRERNQPSPPQGAPRPPCSPRPIEMGQPHGDL